VNSIAAEEVRRRNWRCRNRLRKSLDGAWADCLD
jgi:hypothetical protein